MSNFNFLSSEWNAIYREAKEAENLSFTSPKACVIICRSALEKAIHWLYAHDPDLTTPYDTRLAALMHEQCFKDILQPYFLFHEINLIRKLGNNAAHGHSIRKEESLIALKNLFSFFSFLSVYYSEEAPIIPAFNEQLIPKGAEKKETLAAIKQLEEALQQKNEQAVEEQEKLAQQAKLITSLQAQLKAKEQVVKARKEEREKTIEVTKVIPRLTSEQVTRKLYIDQSLKEAYWDKLRKGYELEYEVKGMPASTNPSGRGYADYVLWGDDGKPLAVIEAKKSMADPREGKHQATLYADCLAQMHGQRPVIFYTNGFETYLWDDTFYPERLVQGFYTKDELQLLINRRSSRKDLRNFNVNEAIIDRYYQKEAIQRVSEAFVREVKGKMKAGARKALLVMATGSGKTRTSAALVDLFTKCNWAKRILFLADRNALVSQAKNAFNEHLPHLSAIDLTKEKEDTGTRLVFSTYPTIMNKIDAVKSNDKRFYGVGHFDLVIIDEAHRSVYQKYGALFDYFDSMLIGLTATPKKDIGTNTYSLFEIEDDNPTYAYELDTAVKDGFLTPPKAISVPVKFIREGIKYHELSEAEKEEYEQKFGDPTTGEVPDEIAGSALNSWLFNTNTVDQVLNHLMTDGIKVQGGDQLGKTIIFAKNHAHADFIERRFNKHYPEHAGHFLKVIDNYESKAQDLLEKFVDPIEENDPQIAVSVDMMDTGVDAPRVVNLVFFKLVRSYSKFWQMVGRGTRLCPNLFGPNQDKQHFIIFDYCQNFEFFKENPDGITGNTVISLSQRIVELKLDIIVATRDKASPSPEETALAAQYTEELYHQVKSLDSNRFQVQMNLRYVTQFSDQAAWATLGQTEVLQFKSHVSKLILPSKNDHELARRFDIIMLNLKLAMLVTRDATRFMTKVVSLAKQLSKVNVPEIKNNAPLLKEVQTETFWVKAHVKRLDEVRKSIRELMKYLESSPKETVYTSLEDDIDLSKVEEVPLMEWSTKLQSYKDRVESYIRKNRHHLTIQKLRSNVPITKGELQALEMILFDGQERGTKQEFVEEYGTQPLGVFIRSIVGLDLQAANEAFSTFIQNGNLRADQMTFIKNIISFLERNGIIDTSMLFDSPFTDLNDQGLGVFDNANARKIISIVEQINKNAEVA